MHRGGEQDLKKFIIALVIALTVLVPCVLAEGDISPYLDGENLFNETVDSLTSGSFTLNPVELMRRFW